MSKRNDEMRQRRRKRMKKRQCQTNQDFEALQRENDLDTVQRWSRHKFLNPDEIPGEPVKEAFARIGVALP